MKLNTQSAKNDNPGHSFSREAQLTEAQRQTWELHMANRYRTKHKQPRTQNHTPEKLKQRSLKLTLLKPFALKTATCNES